MKNDLSSLLNIGKDTEKKLKLVGIDTADRLKETGAEEAFIRLQTIDPGSCISLLYGLEGAITETKWNKLTSDRKKELLEFFKAVKKQNTCF